METNTNKKQLRFNEYVQNLREQQEHEQSKKDISSKSNNEKELELTSPVTNTTTEDNRLLMDYMNRANLFLISRYDEKHGRILKLRRFFKLRRNQQVEVYSIYGKESVYTEGKVSAIGRDFVMLINLKNRIWIPYKVITSANIPYGIPNYSNTHQNFMYDNNYRDKLLTQFGETVAKRDILRQHFYEESLLTNLRLWESTWVEVYLESGIRKTGKITIQEDDAIMLHSFNRKEQIDIQLVQQIKTIRFLAILSHFMKAITYFNKK